MRAYGEAHGIATEAWSPIAKGQVLDDPVIARDRRRRSTARRRRWCCAGTSSAGASCSRSRRRRRGCAENLGLFDFELSPADVERIAGLDRGEAGRTGRNPDMFDRV